MPQQELFGTRPHLPPGFSYAPQFLAAHEEQELLQWVHALPFEAARYRQWRARRRIVAFGGRYDFAHRALLAAPPIPDFLAPLRARVAHWAGVAPEGIAHAIITEYQPGTPLGWHRDIAEFEIVAGVSLEGHARMRFRPWPPQPATRSGCAIELEPRSAYLMQGAARWGWQHAVAPTTQLRYSITFRTRRR
jgi:alkylated DNA repair dioxygenase AlkB